MENQQQKRVINLIFWKSIIIIFNNRVYTNQFNLVKMTQRLFDFPAGNIVDENVVIAVVHDSKVSDQCV